MNPSPLQLEHYELGSLQIEPVDGYVGAPDSRYPVFDNADFESFVEFGKAERGDEALNFLWGIKLRLKGGPKENASFPYHFDVSIVGFLNGKRLPENRRQDLVLVNGTSLLYGVLRDEVLRITSRMRPGPLMLPTTQFHSLAKSSDSSKVEEKVPNTASSAKRQPKLKQE